MCSRDVDGIVEQNDTVQRSTVVCDVGRGQTSVGVTVGVGVAGYPDHGEAADRVSANADKALYLAKGLGKKRREIYR
jgi:GGDEF domain-containing protein